MDILHIYSQLETAGQMNTTMLWAQFKAEITNDFDFAGQALGLRVVWVRYAWLVMSAMDTGQRMAAEGQRAAIQT